VLNVAMVIERSEQSVSFASLSRIFNTNQAMLRYNLGKARKLELVLSNVKRNVQGKKNSKIAKYRENRTLSEKLKKNWF